MKNKKREFGIVGFLLISAFLGFLVAVILHFNITGKSVDGAENVETRFENNILKIITPRYEVHWRNGNMIYAKNLLTNTEITLPNPVMSDSFLPTGIASFYPGISSPPASLTQYYFFNLWNGNSPSPNYQMQYYPQTTSNVNYEQIPNGARLTYSGLKGDSEGKIIQEFRVDETTGDLIISQKGELPNKPGVFGIEFDILNLNPNMSFLFPMWGGVVINGNTNGVWSNQLIMSAGIIDLL